MKTMVCLVLRGADVSGEHEIGVMLIWVTQYMCVQSKHFWMGFYLIDAQVSGSFLNFLPTIDFFLLLSFWLSFSCEACWQSMGRRGVMLLDHILVRYKCFPSLCLIEFARILIYFAFCLYVMTIVVGLILFIRARDKNAYFRMGFQRANHKFLWTLIERVWFV